MGRKNNRRRTSTRDNWSNIERYNHTRYDDDKQGHGFIRLENTPEYKNANQRRAHEAIKANTLTFLSGPAGTAKSFFAIYEAVKSLLTGRVSKIVITRPMVVQGEKLGFLPGGVEDKINPYLMPVLDHLEFFLGKEQVKTLREAGVIEAIPIQIMRGRNLNDAFIVIDEGQNAEAVALKLALTRIGFNSKCVVTLDCEQIDLKYPETSCVHDVWRFENKPQIGFFEFGIEDIVRSEICAIVIDAYKEKIGSGRRWTKPPDVGIGWQLRLMVTEGSVILTKIECALIDFPMSFTI